MNSPPDLQLTAPPENNREQCDLVLGLYMRSWDQVEIQLLPLFNKILGTHQNATLVLLHVGIDQPTLRNILSALMSFRLDAADQSKLKSILRRWETASTKRNRIVHGKWLLKIKMVKGSSGKNDHTKSSWVRFYEPADPTVHAQIFGRRPDQKTVSSRIFRLEDIVKAANDVRLISKDMEKFIGQATMIPFVMPKPIDLDQQGVKSTQLE